MTMRVPLLTLVAKMARRCAMRRKVLMVQPVRVSLGADCVQ